MLKALTIIVIYPISSFIRIVKINLTSFKEFFSSKSAGGIVLLICVVISLVIANSGAGDAFEELLSAELGRNLGT